MPTGRSACTPRHEPMSSLTSPAGKPRARAHSPPRTRNASPTPARADRPLHRLEGSHANRPATVKGYSRGDECHRHIGQGGSRTVEARDTRSITTPQAAAACCSRLTATIGRRCPECTEQFRGSAYGPFPGTAPELSAPIRSLAMIPFPGVVVTPWSQNSDNGPSLGNTSWTVTWVLSRQNVTS